ncbi:hypothetical protein P5V15_005699 [Pogonomyrmex californicus]
MHRVSCGYVNFRAPVAVRESLAQYYLLVEGEKTAVCSHLPFDPSRNLVQFALRSSRRDNSRSISRRAPRRRSSTNEIRVAFRQSSASHLSIASVRPCSI